MLGYMSAQDKICSDVFKNDQTLVKVCYILAQTFVRSNWNLQRSTQKVPRCLTFISYIVLYGVCGMLLNVLLHDDQGVYNPLCSHTQDLMK